MKKIAVLPSMLTLGNLLCGFYALRLAVTGSFVAAAWLVLFAMLFDALDGKVARLTRASSRFGAELDSLADMVSFGVAPALLVYALASANELGHPRLIWLSCAVYAVCAALRLARFNVETPLDEASHQFFRGLPSPAAAGQVVSLVILHSFLVEEHDAGLVVRLIPAVTFFTGILMVTRIRYPHLVSRFLAARHAFAEIVFLTVVALLLITHREVTLAAGFTIFTVAGVLGVAHHLVFHKADEEEEPVF